MSAAKAGWAARIWCRLFGCVERGFRYPDPRLCFGVGECCRCGTPLVPRARVVKGH